MSFKMKGWSGWSPLKAEKRPESRYFSKDKHIEIKPSIEDMDDYRIRQEGRFRFLEDYEPSYRSPKKPKKSSYDGQIHA